MDVWLWATLIALAAVFLFAPIPKSMRNKSTQKRHKKYPTSGAILGAVNEIFYPSAQNAATIQEQKQEAGRENPSPEDKPVP